MARAGVSPWAPFRQRTFSLLWLGGLVVYLAVWIQNVGAAWLMTTLAASPLMVALIQTATTLPAFLLSLPGGVVADLVDRRKYLISTLCTLTLTGLLLVLFTVSGLASPWLLLLLTFALGAGVALQTPAWFSVQIEAVPPELIPSALALGSISFNVARAVGPALAGLTIPLLGVEFAFAVVAGCFVLALGCVLLGTGRSAKTQAAPGEGAVAALRGIVRYARHGSVIRDQLWRTFSFVVAASALWALLPLVAKQQLSHGAQGYGYLLGSLGVGAVVGAILSPRLLSRFGINLLVSMAIVLFGAVVAAVSWIHDLTVMCGVLFFAGVGWQLVGNFNLSAIQTSVPSWVRGRSISVYMLVFQGSMALGALVWGTVAQHWGVAAALHASAVALVIAVAVARALPAHFGDIAQTTTVASGGGVQPPPGIDPRAGPLLVEIEYFVLADDRAAFLDTARQVGRIWRRDGAESWRVYQDAGDASRFVVLFRVASWAAWQLHQSRRTLGDIRVEERLRALHCREGLPLTRQYLQPRPP